MSICNNVNIVFLDAASVGRNLNFDRIHALGCLEVHSYTHADEIIDKCQNKEVIITNKVIFDKSTLEQLPHLKLLCVTGTGFNNIDIQAAKMLNITVANVVDYSTFSVAQHTFAMLLYLNNNIMFYDQYVKSKDYVEDKKFLHFSHLIQELSQKTFGIVGMGNIGRQVAKIAEAFGAHVIYYSTSGNNREQPYRCVDFDSLLSESDILSIHAPLNDQTRNLFDLNAFKKMKPTSILINCGRGAIVKETDLIEALQQNYIYKAGIDVLEIEPMHETSPFLKQQIDPERLLITPHVGWAAVEARQRCMDEVALNIKAFLGNEIRNRIN